MIEDTIIIINSSDRADDSVTHLLFKDIGIKWMYAVPKKQFKKYNSAIKHHVVAIPESVPNCLSDQRQWVMEHFSKEYKYIWLMDDDLVFLYRKEALKLRKCEEIHIKQMAQYMTEQSRTIPYVGIGARFGNNNIGEYKDITRIYQCYIINVEVFKKVNAVFNPISNFLGQDTHMTLCFLNAGYPTRLVGRYAFNEKSSAPGGCSLYRTFESARRSALWLVDNHPEMTLKAKVTKTTWGLTELKNGKRCKVDYNIQWKKAYKPKKVRKSGGLSRLLK